jgi:thiamine-phosphate pyrophosphorylase
LIRQTPHNPREIYGILNFETCGDPYSYLKNLLNLRIPWIQIRAKNLPSEELIEFIDVALELKRELGGAETKLIVNDDSGVSRRCGADGVHLGQQDANGVDLRDLRELLGPEAIIGISTHNLDQALAADLLPVSYIAVGPIFQSPTKSGHADVVGLDQLRNISAQVKKPIVAIGGIDWENCLSVLDAGASRVALISALEELCNRSKIEE